MEILELSKENLKKILVKRASLLLVLRTEYQVQNLITWKENILSNLSLTTLTSIYSDLSKELDEIDRLDELPFPGNSEAWQQKNKQIEFVKLLISNHLIDKSTKELAVIERFLADIKYKFDEEI